MLSTKMIKACFILLLNLRLTISRPPRVWAHYLPWYDTNVAPSTLADRNRFGWCASSQNCSDLNETQYTNSPLIGEYSQFDNITLEYHLLGALVAGMDGFIVNWDPASNFQTAIIDNIFAQTEMLNSLGANLSLMISYDTSGTTLDQMKEYFAIIKSKWTNSSAYFLDDAVRSPVILLWSDEAISNYSVAARSVFADDIFLVARNAVNAMAETEGNFEWVTPSTYYVSNTSTDWGSGYYDDFDWTMARQTSYLGVNSSLNYLTIGAVWPGFDDENVPYSWNGGLRRLINRNVKDGRVMDLGWKQMLDYTPQRLGGEVSVLMPWIQVITWNDWPEGTSIEPATSSTYSTIDYIICRNRTYQFKGLTSNTTEEIAASIAYDIYEARLMHAEGVASAAIQNVINNDYDAAISVLITILSRQPTTNRSYSPIMAPSFQPTTNPSLSPTISSRESDDTTSKPVWMKYVIVGVGVAIFFLVSGLTALLVRRYPFMASLMSPLPRCRLLPQRSVPTEGYETPTIKPHVQTEMVGTTF